MTTTQDVYALGVSVPMGGDTVRLQEVFKGYDSVNGDERRRAVIGGTAMTADNRAVYHVCTDLEQVQSSFGIDASLSASYGSIASVSAKSKFLSDMKVTTYSVSIVVSAKHLTTVRALDVELSPDIHPHPRNQLKEFVKEYGDSFVNSGDVGSEYYAMYTYYSQTREEQTSLETELHAHGVFGGGSVSADLQTKLTTFHSSTRTRSAFDQMSLGIEYLSLPPAEKLAEFALDFTSKVPDAPTITNLKKAGYETLPGLGDWFGPMSANRRHFDGLHKKLELMRKLNERIQSLKKTYAFYKFRDVVVDDVEREIKADEEAIHAQTAAYRVDPTQRFPTIDPPSLGHGMPTLHCDIGRSYQYNGGGGGHQFDHVPNITAYVEQQTRITSVQLRSGSRIDRLVVEYQSKSGKAVFGEGSDGGGEYRPALPIQDGEFVTKIAGRAGSRVDQLTIVAGDQYTSAGGGGGNAFEFTPPTGSFVAGFFGRCGSELDAIGVVYGTFKPAVWGPGL
jgi:hypothetical protein